MQVPAAAAMASSTPVLVVSSETNQEVFMFGNTQQQQTVEV